MRADPPTTPADGESVGTRTPGIIQPVWDPRTGAWVEPMRARIGTEPQPRGRSRWNAALVGGLAGAVTAALVAVPVARLAAPDRPAVERRVADRLPATVDGTSSIVDIAAQARPWVVNVNVSTSQRTLFGDLQALGLGSGVILRSDGHIITNAHVVEGANEIEVTLASGERLPATIVGTDTDTDIAVVRVNRDDLPAAVIGSVRDVRVGDIALAIGSPLGLEQTVTSGIISAVGRTVPRGNAPPLVDMIQTDAPITQGNSGGALIDGSGAVVGINAAIAASPEVGAEGIAFAIPIDVAVAVAEELIETGRATHPWLGVTGGNITPEAAEQFGVEQGALMIEIVPGGPADRAGIRSNDVVVSFDGQRIEGMDDLVVAIRQRQVGDSVRLTVIRDGERITVRAELGDKPDNIQ